MSLLTSRELEELRYAPAEAIGPGGARTSLAFALDADPAIDADWLSTRNCPVIGIGAGPLAAACDVVLEDDRGLSQIEANVARAPIASMVLVQLLRMGPKLPIQDALVAESLAFATLQRGPEFGDWYRAASFPTRKARPEAPLRVARNGSKLRLTFAAPDSRNAIDIEMRDELCEALDIALLDDSIDDVSLDAAGSCFSSGGAVEEFGSSSDPATAHWIRSLRLPATRLARLGPRLRTHIQGAAIGAGIEIAAFSGRLTASDKAWFQLPELRYGLIPGAGGTVSIAKRIGRQRTALLALTMQRLRPAVALEWGLVDELV